MIDIRAFGSSENLTFKHVSIFPYPFWLQCRAKSYFVLFLEQPHWNHFWYKSKLKTFGGCFIHRRIDIFDYCSESDIQMIWRDVAFARGLLQLSSFISLHRKLLWSATDRSDSSSFTSFYFITVYRNYATLFLELKLKFPHRQRKRSPKRDQRTVSEDIHFKNTKYYYDIHFLAQIVFLLYEIISKKLQIATK